LVSFACSDQKKKKWRYTLGYSERAAIRREKCDIFDEGKNGEAIRESRCLEMAVQTCPLLGNSFVTQQWNNWEAVFLTRSMLIAT
jgi:hypothetical protein